MSDSSWDNAQAKRFLARLQAMNPESYAAFQRIYHLAPKAQPHIGSAFAGPHVRLAMIEALVHPDIAYWVRMNLAIRVTRKFSQTAGLHDKAERLSLLLEDFHIATDAFIHHIPVEMAQMQRQTKMVNNPKLIENTALYPLENSFSADQLATIQTFKQQIIPGFVHAIRQRYIKTA